MKVTGAGYRGDQPLKKPDTLTFMRCTTAKIYG